MKRMSRVSSLRSTVFFVLIAFLLPPDAVSSDLHELAEKLGIDYKNIPPVTFRIGTMAPSGTLWLDFPIARIVKKVKFESEGAVRIQVIGGGDDIDILTKMKKGEFIGCGCSSMGINNAIPEASVFSLPFLFRNYDEVDHVMKIFRKDITDMFAKKGYRLFSIIDTGFLYLFTKDKTSSKKDLENVKLANWNGEVEKTTFDELRVRYAPIPVDNIFNSPKMDLIQGVIAPFTWELATQAFLYLPNFVDTPFFYSLAAMMVDEKQVKELEKAYPPGFIAGLMDYLSSEMALLEKDWNVEIREFEKKCINAFVNSGRTSVSWPQAEVDALHMAAQKVKKTLAGKMFSQEFLTRVESELARFRRTADKPKKP